MTALRSMFMKYIYNLYPPDISVIDVLEILILAFTIYHISLWLKRTRAWTLMKGIVVLFAFYIIAYALGMSVITWIFEKTLALGITALIIVFQPELRTALEQLGRRTAVANIFSLEDQKEKQGRLSDRSINELVKASVEMGKARTGALIVLEKEISLSEYERTGINLDSVISSQLLINIFEHNTPLHDGAIIVRGDRIVSATCYLPLSDNMRLSKDLGTRHRAGVGISEVSDSLTIIVSEETGSISVAVGGKLHRNLDGDILRWHLTQFQGKASENRSQKSLWKNIRRNKAQG